MADFYSKDIRSRCGLSATQLNNYINPRAKSNGDQRGVTSKMMNIGSLLLEMESMFGYNAAFIAGICAIESGWGTNNFAQKYNSLMGVMAYNSKPEETAKAGGGTLRGGLINSLTILKNTFFDKYGKYTINQIQSAPAYAQQDSKGTPTKDWTEGVPRIWANIMGDSNSGVFNPKPGTPGVGGGSTGASGSYKAGRQQTWYTYSIVGGDTLNSICKKFGITLQFLCKWNGIRETDTFAPGEKLKVYPMYAVVNGDTLGAIANDFSTSVETLKKLNSSIGSGNQIYPGQKIRLPESAIFDNPPGSPGSNGLEIGGDGLKQVVLDSPTVVGSAPPVYADEYPKHRFADTPFSIRIGDTQFFMPPSAIRVNHQSSVTSQYTLRQKTGTATKSGYAKREVSIDLVFADTDQINGYKIKGPNGQIYYMDGLRALIGQLAKNPFMPVRNELLNDYYHIYNIALYNIDIATVDGFPNVLAVQLQFLECTVEPICQYPDFFYDNLIMYPLFRWWYQQQLWDDRTKAKSGTYLRPVTPGSMNGGIAFKVLDRDLINEMETDKLDQYQLSKLKLPDLAELMSEWPIGDAILEAVTVKIGKVLTPLQCDDQTVPAFQDMGITNKSFALQFFCTSREELDALHLLASYLEEMSRDYRNKFVSGYLQVDNEILNMAGIYYAMVTSIQSTTIEGYDDNFRVTMYGQSFEPTQKSNERLFGVNNIIADYNKYLNVDSDIVEKKTTKGKHEILYETKIEHALRLLELYPDLELPTYDDVNAIIPMINKLRSSRNYPELPIQSLPPNPDAAFVDPDFYFAYPNVSKVFDELEVGDMGEEIINQINHGTFTDWAVNDNKESFGAILDGMNIGLIENWQDDANQKGHKITAQQKVTWNSEPKYFTTQIGHGWTPDNHPRLDPGMLTMDMVYYNKRGRMLRAWPSYLILFVDEGQWMSGRRLWNNYYMYHAVQQIDVVKDKDNPVDLAYISMSNIYGAFDFTDKLSSTRDAMKTAKTLSGRIKSLWDDFWLTLDDKDIYERTQMLEQARIRQGARVHIRLGYGSAASGLPIVFNGQVAEINEGEFDVQMVCQGDGAELVAQIIGTTPGDSHDLPEESKNFFEEILTTRKSDFFFANTAEMGFFDNYQSMYGIEHFGQVVSEADGGFWSFLGGSIAYTFKQLITGGASKGYITYDVMKNIYRGVQEPWTQVNKSVFDGEMNVQVEMYGKTAWDGFQTHAAYNPEFVCAVHPHGFRSTLFFGQPHWMVKYGYIENATSFDPSNPKNYSEKYKPFQQFHMIQSGYDIIHNNIKASNEKIRHSVTGIYAESGGSKPTNTDTVYADRSIYMDQQKSMLIDTMVVEDLFGPDWLIKGGRWVYSRVGVLIDDLGSIVEDAVDVVDELWGKVTGKGTNGTGIQGKLNTGMDWERIRRPGHVNARTIAIGALQRSFAEMYQGELIIFGDPAIKPHDIFYLSDDMKMMTGTAQVGKVTHSLSMQTGFVTVIKPDLCVTRTEGLDRNAYMQMFVRLGSLISIQMTRKLVASKAAKWLAIKTGKGTAWGIKSLGSVTAKSIGKVSRRAARRTKVLFGKGWRAGTKAVASVKNGTAVVKAARFAKSTVVLAVVTEALATWLEDVIRKETAFNNCIYIYPLWKYNRPFVAGISGAKYIIPNYVAPEDLTKDESSKVMIPNGSYVHSNMGTNNVTILSSFKDKVVAPVDGMRVTSKWGMRVHPTSGVKTFHNGLDIGATPRGTTPPIKAVAAGVVKVATYSKDAGYFVAIQHKIDGQDYYIRYLHMKQGSLKVKAGDKVTPGQQIGTMGTTGNSTGVHLHIEVSQGTYTVKDMNDPRCINPVNFFSAAGIKLTS